MTTDVFIEGIADPGTPFTVTDKIKDTIFSAGTSGFVSYILGPDHSNPNIVFKTVVTNRRGMKGKDRIDTNTILTPIVTIKGVENERLLPSDGERKHLIDLKMVTDYKGTIEHQSNTEFMGWLLSRVLFSKELDKVIYPSTSLISQTLGLTGPKQASVWKDPDTSLLKKFSGTVESYSNDGRIVELEELFCEWENKIMLIKELAVKDAHLAIPRLEYNRKVHDVINDALTYVAEVISDIKVDNKDDILTKISEMSKINYEKYLYFDKMIRSKLSIIVENRKLLKI